MPFLRLNELLLTLILKADFYFLTHCLNLINDKSRNFIHEEALF
ncbi:hypothetical protein [Chryseobacterium aureum]|nr:hypothetical protein [Chryseobacterium aureum]